MEADTWNSGHVALSLPKGLKSYPPVWFQARKRVCRMDSRLFGGVHPSAIVGVRRRRMAALPKVPSPLMGAESASGGPLAVGTSASGGKVRMGVIGFRRMAVLPNPIQRYWMHNVQLGRWVTDGPRT